MFTITNSFRNLVMNTLPAAQHDIHAAFSILDADEMIDDFREWNAPHGNEAQGIVHILVTHWLCHWGLSD